MLPSIPLFIYLLFGFSVVFVFVCIYHASQKSGRLVLLLLAWLIAQSAISLGGFYQNTLSMPPRFLLLVAPGLIAMLLLLLIKRGRRFLQSFNLHWLLVLHAVRLPVELVLFELYGQKLVPVQMTFAGWNFDVISGITAPIILLLLRNGRAGTRTLLAWNVLCLLLLINIVATAILAAPTPFQQLAFEQPNRAVFYFPFTLLPGFIVPLVLFSHLAMLVRLVSGTKSAAET